jgi:PPOX class probable F420-dependent enzyme
MIDLTTEFGKQVEQRLKSEEVIWLTTVTPDGRAQPNPVWFYWDGKAIIIYSEPGSFRIRNLEQNPRVALNLQGVDVLGNHAVIISGQASIKHGYSQPHPGYVEKYIGYLDDMHVTYEQLCAKYSVEINITPTGLHS